MTQPHDKKGGSILGMGVRLARGQHGLPQCDRRRIGFGLQLRVEGISVAVGLVVPLCNNCATP